MLPFEPTLPSSFAQVLLPEPLTACDAYVPSVEF
jgi:hypothetical protein